MADSKWDLCNKIGFTRGSLEQRCFLCTDPYLHARRDKRWEGKILWSILQCINKLVWSPCSDFRAKITPHGSWSFYLWATTSKSHLNNACNACGFCPFFFFFFQLVVIQPRICTIMQSSTLEQRWRRREEGKNCAVTCVTYKAAMNFCTNLWCNPKSQAGWLLTHCFCSTKPSYSLFQSFMVFL